MRFPDRIFKTLMRALPSELRADYEREMTATFRSERRAASGTAGLIHLWVATIADVVRTAPSEHFDILRRDLVSHTVRMLWRRPTLTLTAIVTLALGIGANTAIFSVINGVLLAPLPYPDADRLVRIEEARADRDPGTTGYFSFAALGAESRTFESIAAFSGWSAILAGDGRDAERVTGARVSWEYFRTLGIRPALGRDFEVSEDHPDRRRVAIISDALWKRRYGGDPRVIGQPFTINQATYVLAGVMPPGLTELITARTFPETHIWTLLGYAESLPQACRSCRHIFVLGRLRDGVSTGQAEADLSRIYQSLAAKYPTDYDSPRAVVTPIREFFLGPVQGTLYLLWGAVGLLLVIACANIANLLLIRASEREEEIAIRRALGVSPARMVRQLLTEALVLASAGGVAGAAVAWWATVLLVANGPAEIPRLDAVTVDGRVLLYALAISVVTGVVFGMAPARMLIVRRDGSGVATRRTTSGPTAWRYRATLIACNVALSVLLLVGSGLLVRSFVRLMAVTPGFESDDVLTLAIGLTGQSYAERAGITAFYDRLSARIAALPDVERVSASTQLPLTGSRDQSGITVEGRVLDNPAAAANADRYAVRPEFFSAMRIPLLRGRVFDERDGERATPVAIVGKTMAESLWPGEDPLGRRIRIAGGADNPMREIIGIVGDVRHYGLHRPETLQVYEPHAQTHYAQPAVVMIVRVAPGRDPLALSATIRDLLREIDPLLPLSSVRTYDAIVAASVATRRFTLALLAAFAATALLLALVGLYGALSYVVQQRQRDIGVRVALGADAREIVRLVLRQGLTPAAIGLGLGLAVSLGAGRLMQSMLFGTSPTDAVTLAIVPGVMAMGACAACLIPARKAAAVDPAVTLKAE